MPSETLIAPGITLIYEDADLLVVNKPAGLVIHPAYKHPTGTLFDAVSTYVQARGGAKPCLLHRLDKDTSGAIVLAKTEQARRHLVRQFEQRTLRKTYLALICGTLHPASGEIDMPLSRDPLDRRRMRVDPEGAPARTAYQILQVLASGVSLVELHPITGRMHQLRIHLAAQDTPIVGDTLYAAPERWAPLEPARQCLHAHVLTFQHPTSGARLSVRAPLPEDIQALLNAITPHAHSSLNMVSKKGYNLGNQQP